MTNRLVLISIIFFISMCCLGQNYYKLTHSLTKISADEYDLIFTVVIDEGFSILSIKKNQDTVSVIPTTIKFVRSTNYTLIGEMKESVTKEIDHAAFDSKILVHQNRAIFTQRIKVVTKNKFKIKASIESEIFNTTQLTFPPAQIVNFEMPGL